MILIFDLISLLFLLYVIYKIVTVLRDPEELKMDISAETTTNSLMVFKVIYALLCLILLFVIKLSFNYLKFIENHLEKFYY